VVGDLEASSIGSAQTRDDVVLVKTLEGALSLELMPLREDLARGFMRFSPRNFKFSEGSIKELSDALSSRPYSAFIVQDSKKRLLSRHLAKAGWRIERAIPDTLPTKCSIMSPFDLPLDDSLIDTNGARPDMTNTSNMRGISVNVNGRMAWAFYTSDGESARIVSEEERRQGMLVASNAEDMFPLADCLVRYIASMRIPWAVFSMDMGRFVRQFNPVTMLRMVSDRPKPYDHRGVPVSSSNKKALTRLFSEYYDESAVQAMLRLRKYRADPCYSMFVVDGGFVTTKLEGETGLIYDIYVTPARQGEGLGEELMRCGLTSLVGKATSVYLHTTYPRAKRLYEKFGFKAVYSQLGIRLDEVAVRPPRPM
jgi:ribosomal protein S18 acetylase RimI-like enzyme